MQSLFDAFSNVSMILPRPKITKYSLPVKNLKFFINAMQFRSHIFRWIDLDLAVLRQWKFKLQNKNVSITFRRSIYFIWTE